MRNYTSFSSFLILVALLFSSCENRVENTAEQFDIIVLGEGTGATSAAIQSARSGLKTLWVSPLSWSGGMLTAAGVSATDGNNRLPAGLWGEFRNMLRSHYGGADSLFTGWVSNTMFEPKVGEKIWRNLLSKEKNLTVWNNHHWSNISKDKKWKMIVIEEGGEEEKIVLGTILIDGTDLGDVAAAVGVTYDLGMDSAAKTQEKMAPKDENNIIQDLTYAAILKDFGKGKNKTITKPKNYSPEFFYCACKTEKCNQEEVLPCDKMLDYGKLPNDKYMINWPKHGNDFYTNIVEANKEERAAQYQLAKNKTLQFIYYIQTELGYSNLGIAEDEFPTDDGLPLYPYHREGRRIHGETQLTINHILTPYQYHLYRTGIAVGDYPIDHHHAENEDAPEINFPKVPSFNIPMGSLIPKNIDHFLVADKSISVTNIVNGASRLQPVMIQVGQAAGIIAALSVKENKSPNKLKIREVQSALLACKSYLLPFIDLEVGDVHFEAIQRIGATGILKGKGIPFQWANQTWFYPDTIIDEGELLQALKSVYPFLNSEVKDKYLTIRKTIEFIFKCKQREEDLSVFTKKVKANWSTTLALENYESSRLITKKEIAVLVDYFLDPFHTVEIDLQGNFME